MEMANLAKFQSVLAAPLITNTTLSDEAKTLLKEKMSSVDYLQRLIEASLFSDAIRFLAIGLPRRESVWWAYISAEKYERQLSNPLLQELLNLTRNWVYTPSDTNRILLHGPAEKLGFNLAASWAAMAAFWSEGNITPNEKAVVTAPPHLTPIAVAGAILLAGTLYEPEKSKENYLHFLKQGIHIANNGNGEY